MTHAERVNHGVKGAMGMEVNATGKDGRNSQNGQKRLGVMA